MKAILEGYKGKYPASKRGRGKWYKITEREIKGTILETTDEDIRLIAKSKCWAARWRIVHEGQGQVSVKISKG